MSNKLTKKQIEEEEFNRILAENLLLIKANLELIKDQADLVKVHCKLVKDYFDKKEKEDKITKVIAPEVKITLQLFFNRHLN